MDMTSASGSAVERATSRGRVLEALRGRRVRPVPVGAVTQSATLAQMEAAGAAWPEAHGDPEAMASLAGAAREMFGFDLVRVPFDQTVEAGLFGAEVDPGGRDAICNVRSHPAKLSGPLPAPPDLASGRAAAVAVAIRILRRRLNGEAAVLGGLVGPFTLAGQLVGVTNLLIESVRRPDAVRPWLDLAVRVGIDYARRQIEAGADAICVEDMSASLDLTSPRVYENVAFPAQQRLIAGIPVPVILHVCGGNTRILGPLLKTGAAALSLDAKTDLAAAASMGTCAIVGGVPPVEVLLNGTPDDVRAAARRSLEAGVHLLAPGCGLPPATPTDNLRALALAAKEWP